MSGFARQAICRANDTCEVEGITPHRLRGTFATLMFEAGVLIQTVQRVLRHKGFTIVSRIKLLRAAFAISSTQTDYLTLQYEALKIA